MIQVYYITKMLVYQRFLLRYQTIFLVMLLNGIQEVSGSIPLISTIQKALKLNGFGAFLYDVKKLGSITVVNKIN